MDRSEVQIVAAAPGQIVYRSDGNFDRSCDWTTTTNWNAIQVQHADGSRALYGHMKKGRSRRSR
jgi:murein DD-endopeptidase MepM/ murein hydrolase activator NlpD